MRDVMSYYSEGTPYFSVFLKDSLYRTSSYVIYYRNKPVIDAYVKRVESMGLPGKEYVETIRELIEKYKK